MGSVRRSWTNSGTDSVQSVQQQATSAKRPSYPGFAPRSRTVQTEGLTTDELSGLLAIAKGNGTDVLLDALEGMMKAIVKANSRYVSEQLMAFVEAHEIPSLMVEDNPEICDSVSKYISTILFDVIARWISPQPQKPANWCLPHKGCGSSRCSRYISPCSPCVTSAQLHGNQSFSLSSCPISTTGDHYSTATLAPRQIFLIIANPNACESVPFQVPNRGPTQSQSQSYSHPPQTRSASKWPRPPQPLR